PLPSLLLALSYSYTVNLLEGFKKVTFFIFLFRESRKYVIKISRFIQIPISSNTFAHLYMYFKQFFCYHLLCCKNLKLINQIRGTSCLILIKLIHFSLHYLKLPNMYVNQFITHIILKLQVSLI